MSMKCMDLFKKLLCLVKYLSFQISSGNVYSGKILQLINKAVNKNFYSSAHNIAWQFTCDKVKIQTMDYIKKNTRNIRITCYYAWHCNNKEGKTQDNVAGL